MKPLPESFYARDTVAVARDLLGKRLVRREGKTRLSGIILETEAYRGEEDLACHCRAGRTPRTEVMYGPAGRAYVYFIYGMYWLLNIVTEGDGRPGAVLIRAVHSLEGLEVIARRRGGQPPRSWTDGPGKLSRAFNITGEQNGIDLCREGSPLVITDGIQVPPQAILAGPRVGISSVPEPWKSKAWRFVVQYQQLLGE